MKRIITCLAAGFLVIGAQSLKADSTTNSTGTSATAPGDKHKELSPEQREQRQAVMKILGLSKEDLKDLSPKERQAKVKETADKYVADMKAKKAAGTLTDEEKTDLAKVEKFIAHAGHKKPAAAPVSSN